MLRYRNAVKISGSNSFDGDTSQICFNVNYRQKWIEVAYLEAIARLIVTPETRELTPKVVQYGELCGVDHKSFMHAFCGKSRRSAQPTPVDFEGLVSTRLVGGDSAGQLFIAAG